MNSSPVLRPSGHRRDRASDHRGRVALNDFAQCREIRPGARLNDVRSESVAGEDLVSGANPQAYLSLRVFARRDRFDVVLLELTGDRHRRVDGLKERVDRAIPLAVSAKLGTLATDHNTTGGGSARTDARVPADELQRVIGHFELVADERHQVGSGNGLLAISQRQESLVRLVELVLVKSDADLEECVAEPGSARVLAKDETGPFPTNIRWVHDLVCRALFQHSVLVDAGLMGKRVGAHDGLVRLDWNAGQRADESAGRHQTLLTNARRATSELIAACRQGHDH